MSEAERIARAWQAKYDPSRILPLGVAISIAENVLRCAKDPIRALNAAQSERMLGSERGLPTHQQVPWLVEMLSERYGDQEREDGRPRRRAA